MAAWSDLSRAAALCAGVAALLLPASATAEPIWRLEQPDPPPGAPFKVPLGTPGDLKFWSANRGLLAVEGNSTIPRGLFYFNGERWTQLSTVCGGAGDSTKIVWAGPTEFWTITEPSRPRIGSATALCRFKDGQVVNSFSTAEQSADPYRAMLGGACASVSDCWFAGIGSSDPTGERVGGFHLHWDGSALTTFYAPQGRGVTDVQVFGGAWFESTVIGPAPGNTNPPSLAAPESPPRLIHRIEAGPSFPSDPFTFASAPGVVPNGTELLALDTDGQRLWAGGGGAASGPEAEVTDTNPDGFAERLPVVLRWDGGAWVELPLDPGDFSDTDRIVDIAAVPNLDGAWGAVQPYADRASTNAKAKVALIEPDGTATVTRLPTSGAGRGSAAFIDFTSPSEGWLVTKAGWLFHYTDGTPLPRDEDPAFQNLISFRPNEAAEQFVPDTPPPDDSLLFAPPPVKLEDPAPPTPPEPKKLPALITKVKQRVVNKTTLVLTFKLRRTATIALIAIKKKKTVARTKKKKYRPGSVTLKLKLDPKKWPDRLKFSIKEKLKTSGDGGGDDDTVTTGGGGDTTVTTRVGGPRP